MTAPRLEAGAVDGSSYVGLNPPTAPTVVRDTSDAGRSGRDTRFSGWLRTSIGVLPYLGVGD
jgi:hypothetical protein